MVRLWRVVAALFGSTVIAVVSTASNQSIDRYLDSLRDVKTVTASKTVISSEAPQTNGLDDDRYTCTAETVREQGSMQQLAAFGTNSDVLWPGSIIQGSSLVSNQLAP